MDKLLEKMLETARSKNRSLDPELAPFDRDYFRFIQPDIYYAVLLQNCASRLDRVPDLFLGPLSALFWLAANTDTTPPPECLDPAFFRSWLPGIGVLGQYILLCMEATDTHYELCDPDSPSPQGLIDEIAILMNTEERQG